MSEDYTRQAEKRGFNFTVWEKKKGSAEIALWLCKCPNFVSVKDSPCGIAKTKEEAFRDCEVHMKAKKPNEKALPKKADKPNK